LKRADPQGAEIKGHAHSLSQWQAVCFFLPAKEDRMNKPQHAPILVVGRESDHLSVLTKNLETFGCVVFRATGMDDWVLPLIRTAPIYLIFFDVETERGTYADLIDVLRTERSPTKLVVTSRLGPTAEYIEAMQLGAYDFVSPPIRQSELARLLQNSQPGP
jgi:DNA-binding NtrC family response regulator